MATTTKVLILLFDGFNTLDVNGPLEIFNKSNFTVDIAADCSPTASSEHAVMTPNKILDKHLYEQLSSYDMLVVPGANSDPVEAKIENPGSWFNKFILKFASLPAQSDGPTGLPKKRILFSVCTGALFLANLGVFSSNQGQPPIYCTTHWLAYTSLLKYCNAAVASIPGQVPGVVLPARFVDNGPVATASQQDLPKVRIVSSGGVSCCLDGSLHVVKLIAGYDVAYATAKMIDYPWRQTEGVVFNDENIYKPAVVPKEGALGSQPGGYSD